MSTNAHDQTITNEKIKIQQARDAGDQLVLKFQEVTGRFLPELAQYLVERAIENQPEVAKSLGTDKLAEMKEEYKALLDQYPDLIAEGLDHDETWPHRQQIPDDVKTNTMIKYDLNEKTRASVSDEIRHLIGHVGSILIKYGLVSLDQREGWLSGRDGTPRYSRGFPSGIQSSDELEKLHKEYEGILEQFINAGRNLEVAEHAKASAEAKDLWDKI